MKLPIPRQKAGWIGIVLYMIYVVASYFHMFFYSGIADVISETVFHIFYFPSILFFSYIPILGVFLILVVGRLGNGFLPILALIFFILNLTIFYWLGVLVKKIFTRSRPN